ncbi:uncharacterized protein LOC132601765 [Lycium barbarum]|uniref:uncharacterized protein LOC132601765 n=1 Tax=Lycium barbarum TaxID=112863 RepID=UPI00293EA784|nr:uncharacterized protein LOC132601765 [Lycium barbarum]
MAPKKKKTMEPPAIVTTRSSTRSGKAKLDSNSDTQPPTVVTTRSSTRSNKAKLDSISDPQVPPKSKKRKTNTSDNGNASSSSKKKANMEPTTAIATRSSNRILNSPLAVSQKSKFKKPQTPPKKTPNVGPIVTRSSTRITGRQVHLLTTKVSELTISEGKTAPSSPADLPTTGVRTRGMIRRLKGKGKMDDSTSPKSKKTRRSIFEVGSTSTSMQSSKKRVKMEDSKIKNTRRGKAKMGSDPDSDDPEPPKSKKAKGTMSITSSSTRRGKGKMGSDADPEPPKSKKAKDSMSTSRGKAKMGSDPVLAADPESQKSKRAKGKGKMGSDPTSDADPEPPKSQRAKGKAKMGSDPTSDPEPPKTKKAKGKAKMGSNPTPPADPEPPKSKKAKKGNSSVSETPKKEENGEASKRVTRSSTRGSKNNN